MCRWVVVVYMLRDGIVPAEIPSLVSDADLPVGGSGLPGKLTKEDGCPGMACHGYCARTLKMF